MKNMAKRDTDRVSNEHNRVGAYKWHSMKKLTFPHVRYCAREIRTPKTVSIETKKRAVIHWSSTRCHSPRRWRRSCCCCYCRVAKNTGVSHGSSGDSRVLCGFATLGRSFTKSPGHSSGWTANKNTRNIDVSFGFGQRGNV